MGALLKISDVLDAISRTAGRWASFIILPLVFIIIFDVISRKTEFIKQWSADITIAYGYSPSFILQDLQWHLHGVLLLMTFGFGYLHNSHVRVDIFRETASRRKQVWIETIGLVFFALPFLFLMVKFSWDMTYASFQQGEGSESQVGLEYRYIIKSFLVWGFTTATMAAVATLGRCLAYLFGNEATHAMAEQKIQFFTDTSILPKVKLDDDSLAQKKPGGDGE